MLFLDFNERDRKESYILFNFSQGETSFQRVNLFIYFIFHCSFRAVLKLSEIIRQSI